VHVSLLCIQLSSPSVFCSLSGNIGRA